MDLDLKGELSSFNANFFLKLVPSHFHVNESLSKDHPSFEIIFSKKSSHEISV